jgi:hypothetical protein
MTVRRLRREMTAAEFVQWAAYDRVRSRLQERAEREAARRHRRRLAKG